MIKNEFLSKGSRSAERRYTANLLNFVVPIFIFIIGFFLSAQKFAEKVSYNKNLCGNPIFSFPIKLGNLPKGYPIFNPLKIFSSIILKIRNPLVRKNYEIFIFGIILTVFVCAVSYLLIKTFKSLSLFGNDKLFGTARWGTKKDLQKYGLCEKYGVVLAQQWSAKSTAVINSAGNFGLKIRRTAPLICHAGTSHTLMIAPTRTGKGVGSIVPTCVSYRESMIIFDPKGELYNMTAGYRKRFSHVIKFSPVQEETACFNPLEEIDLGSRAFRDIGTVLTNLFQKSNNGDSNSDFFDNNARDLLTGVIFHVLSARDEFGEPLYDKKVQNLSGIVSIFARAATSVDENGEPLPAGEELLDEMLNSRHFNKEGNEDTEIHNIIADVAMSAKQQHERVRSDIMQTIQSKLNLFRDPLIKHATSHSDFKLSDFYESEAPVSLYLTLPFGDIDRVMPIFQLIIDFILRRFSSGELRAKTKEMKLKHPILFLLDEFPTLGNMSFLATSMGVLAGYGLRFFIVVQAYNQLVKIYGEQNTFIDNCRYIILYAPNNPTDSERFSKMIGKETVMKENISLNGSKFGMNINKMTTTGQEMGHDLINADELMKLPYTDAIVLCQGMPAYMAKKCAFYDDERFNWKVFFENQNTGNVESGFEAPYSQEEINAECAGLPSQQDL